VSVLVVHRQALVELSGKSQMTWELDGVDVLTKAKIARATLA
jgi:hypothetical protein